MKRHISKTASCAALAIAATGAADIARAANTRVQVNGQPLATSVAPIQMNGRTLVPMRDIFESLGARVQYNSATRGITARRGTTNIGLRIGSRAAMINNQNITLDQSPLVRRGSTLVPLRFVSEALGARVSWNSAQRLVSVYQGGSYPSGSQVASARTISVPAGAVVPVTLDEELTSGSARTGQSFSTTVVSATAGDSEFPSGTRIEGVVTRAIAKTDKAPGVLDLSFSNVVLPDGTRYPVRAGLVALDNENVTTTRGRVMAKENTGSNNKDRNKTIVIGAGAGFLLGKVLKQNSTLTAVLGAAAGYFYDKKKSGDRMAEAVVPEGTRLGVRLDRALSYSDATYYPVRSTYFK